MQRVLIAIAFMVGACAAGALANYTATPGSGLTFLSFDSGGVKSAAATLANSAGTEILTAAAPGQVSLANTGANATAIKVNVASGGIASGAVASGAIASGAVASGAYASGSISSGAIVDLTNGSQKSQIVDGSGNVIAATSNALNVNVSNANANGQATMANSSPVVIASNQSNLNVVGAGSAGTANSGVVTVQGIASMTPVLATLSGTNSGVQPVSGTTGGASVYHVLPAASDNHVVIKNGAGTAYGVFVTNNSATKNYFRLYDAGTGFNGCNSATGILLGGEIPPTDSGVATPFAGAVGVNFSTGLSVCITSGYGDTDTTNATATAMSFNAFYK